MTASGEVMRLAAELFGGEFSRTQRYVDILGTEGVVRGLIGPRETDRLWDRHIVNSAVVAEVIPPSAEVADVGSGAGLPGVPLALARPDLRVVLVEPMRRRCEFLDEVVHELDLADRVRVIRGRAPDVARGPSGLRCDVVAARAVASLDKLGAMLAPVTSGGGLMLALRGVRVDAELAEARSALAAQGWGRIDVVICGEGRLDEPTRVLRAVRSADGGRTGWRSGGDRHGGRTARDARRGREAGRGQRAARGQTRST